MWEIKSKGEMKERKKRNNEMRTKAMKKKGAWEKIRETESENDKKIEKARKKGR